MSDYFTAMAEYRAKRAEITADAYQDLIELVGKHGNRKLKDEMWALVRRATEQGNAAHDAFLNRRSTAGDVR